MGALRNLRSICFLYFCANMFVDFYDKSMEFKKKGVYLGKKINMILF